MNNFQNTKNNVEISNDNIIIDNLNKSKKEKISEIIKESTYLFYEIKDIHKIIKLPSDQLIDGENQYEKEISPLFDQDTINAEFNRDLLDIIFEEVPFYFIESRAEQTANGISLSETRDVGINDVASPLQTDFWEVLFREALGSVQNDLLLNIYNKLRYPFIGENQFLNANLFPELSFKYFSKKKENEKGSQIVFKSTAADNLADIAELKNKDKDKLDNILTKKKKYMGCIDYLNDIVDQKLNSIYTILDYHPSQSNLLDVWVESKVNAGILNKADSDREKTIYKLQDIQHELLKRKFAGSSTLYTLALSSINRRGSLVRTVTVGDVRLNHSKRFFRDSRPLRILNLPNAFPDPKFKNQISPYNTFYENAKKDHKEIPLGIVVPMYYTSSTQSSPEIENKGDLKYDAEFFYNDDPKNKEAFLRNNSRIINWNLPASPLSSGSFNYTYFRLDEYERDEDSLTGAKKYFKLDNPLMLYKETDKPILLEKNTLDVKIPTISSEAIAGVSLDITLDSILFHRNSLQRLLGSNYEYVTYPLSGNASICLMDVEWMNFLKKNTEEKSRVQDNLSFGSQISFYSPVHANQTTPHMFFALSYGGKPLESANYTENFEDTMAWDEWIETYGCYPKYAYLWICSFDYSVSTYFSSNFKSTLISKITLKYSTPDVVSYFENKKETVKDSPWFIERTDDETSEENIQRNINNISKFKDEILEKYTFNNKEIALNSYNTHIGVIPFAYKELKDNLVSRIQLTPIYDDLDDLHYSKAIFGFSDCDLLNFKPEDNLVIEEVNKENEKDEIEEKIKTNSLYFMKGLTEYPTKNTKTVFFGLRDYLGLDKKGYQNYEYRWSAGINVINLSKDIIKIFSTENSSHKGFTYLPDWKGLQYYFNPYLNFTNESSSPLRHKKNIKNFSISDTERKALEDAKIPIDPTKIPESAKISFSSDSALCNLTRMRNLDFLCNDTGGEKVVWNEDIKEILDPEALKEIPYGYYLEHFHKTSEEDLGDLLLKKLAYVDVFGDNRSEDALDILGGDSRSKPYTDPKSFSRKYCLSFKYPEFNFIDKTVNCDVFLNNFKLLPMNSVYLKEFSLTKKEMNAGVEKYEEAVAYYKKSKAEYEDNVKKFEKYLEDIKAYNVNKVEYDEYKKKHDAYKQYVADFEQYVKDLEKYKQAVKDYEAYKAYEEALKEYNQAVENYNKYEAYLEELKKYEADLEKYNSYKKYENDLNTYQEELKQYSTALEEYNKALEEYNKKKAEAPDDLDSWGPEPIKPEDPVEPTKPEGYSSDFTKPTNKPTEVIKPEGYPAELIKPTEVVKPEGYPAELIAPEEPSAVLKPENWPAEPIAPEEPEEVLKPADFTLIDPEEHPESVEGGILPIYNNIWQNWSWNKEKTGTTICCNIELFASDFAKMFEYSKFPEILKDNPGFPIPKNTITEEETKETQNGDTIITKIKKSTSVLKDSEDNLAKELLIGRGSEFSLYISNISYKEESKKIFRNGELESEDFDSKYTFKIYYSAFGTSTVESQEYSINSNDISGNFYRIGVSVGNITVRRNIEINLVINDKIVNKGIIYALKFTSLGTDCKTFGLGINVGSELKEIDGKTYQVNNFYGNIYDLRLYNESLSVPNLIIASHGTTRELYSYAPSNYKLGYSVYKDLGIFKMNKIIKNSDALPAITKIRAFNRSVWDSILIDMYPVSADQANKTIMNGLIKKSSIVYRPDALDPWHDEDIFSKIDSNTPWKDSNVLRHFNDSVEQLLSEDVEVSNNSISFNSSVISGGNVNTRLSYNDKDIIFRDTDRTTVVTTILQPTLYKDSEFDSEAILEYKIENNKLFVATMDNALIDIPISPEKGTFGYTADLSLNFMVDAAASLPTYYLAGSNVNTIFNEKLKRCTVTLKENLDINNKNNSNMNYILTPFTIPSQEVENSTATSGKLRKIEVRNVQFSLALNTFLKAQNYYEEVRIPVIQRNGDNLEDAVYASKWHAIRTLKEGTYYLTFKYPLQILPFSEKDISGKTAIFNTYYATARFKIEVKGHPIKYDSAKYRIEGHDGRFYESRIIGYLKSDSCIIEEDNRVFPHRIVDIDLYVMDENGINNNPGRNKVKRNYIWKLLGSNHISEEDADKDHVLILNEKTVNNPIVCPYNIPMLFARSFTSPYFIAVASGKDNKITNVLPGNIQDDIKKDIYVNVTNSTAFPDNLCVSDISDLGKQRITAGKSYRLLFDYNANLVEFGYNENIINNQNITDEEYSQYTENSKVSLSTRNEFQYSKPNINNGSLLNRFFESNGELAINTSGFQTNDLFKEKNLNYQPTKEELETGYPLTKYYGISGWESSNINNSGLDDESILYFGNPYSSSSDANSLLNNEKPSTLNTLFSFPYVPTEVLEGTTLSSCLIDNAFPVLRDDKTGINNLSGDTFKESAVLSNLADIRIAEVTGALNTFKDSIMGIFEQLSEIIPKINYETYKGNLKVANYSYILSSHHSLYSYETNPININNSTANIKIENYNTYQNNLLKNQNYLDAKSWTIKGALDKKWISDEMYEPWHEGANVFSLRYPTVEEDETAIPKITLKTSISNMNLDSNMYRISVILFEEAAKDDKNPSHKIVDVYANIYDSNNKLEKRVKLNRGGFVGPSIPYTIFTTDIGTISNKVKIDNLEIEIHNKIDRMRAKELRIAKIELRSSGNSSHNLGLSSVLKPEQTDNKLTLSRYQVIAFKKDTEKQISNYIPVMFDNKVLYDNNGKVSGVETYKFQVQTFIGNNSITQATKFRGFWDNKLTKLQQPWICELHFKEGTKTKDEEGHIKYNPPTTSILAKKLINGKFSKSTEESAGIFKEPLLNYDNTAGQEAITVNSISINANRVQNRYGSLPEYQLAAYKSNLKLNTDVSSDKSLVTLSNEKVSGLINCFHGENFTVDNKSNSSLVTVTNLQFLSKKEKEDMTGDVDILCELEYLPIIYDEAKQHLSVNFMLHRKVN